MKNYGRFFNDKNGVSAVLLLTGGIIMLAAALHAVRVNYPKFARSAGRRYTTAVNLCILCGTDSSRSSDFISDLDCPDSVEIQNMQDGSGTGP